jgi:hypothetical protein
MLRTGQSPAPSTGRSSSASTPGSRPTPGVLLPGTLASPRTGLTPAGCRELVARLRRGALLSVVLSARAAGRTFRRNHPVLGARGRPAWLRPPRGRRGRRPAPPGPGSRAATGGPAGTPRALDATRWRRGTGRVAATTAGPRTGAGPGRGVGAAGEAVHWPRRMSSASLSAWMRRRTGSVGGQGSRLGGGGTPRAGVGAQAASGSRPECRRHRCTARPWRPARGRWPGRRRAALRTAPTAPRSAGPSRPRAKSPLR